MNFQFFQTSKTPISSARASNRTIKYKIQNDSGNSVSKTMNFVSSNLSDVPKTKKCTQNFENGAMNRILKAHTLVSNLESQSNSKAESDCFSVSSEQPQLNNQGPNSRNCFRFPETQQPNSRANLEKFSNGVVISKIYNANNDFGSESQNHIDLSNIVPLYSQNFKPAQTNHLIANIDPGKKNSEGLLANNSILNGNSPHKSREVFPDKHRPSSCTPKLIWRNTNHKLENSELISNFLYEKKQLNINLSSEQMEASPFAMKIEQPFPNLDQISQNSNPKEVITGSSIHQKVLENQTISVSNGKIDFNPRRYTFSGESLSSNLSSSTPEISWKKFQGNQAVISSAIQKTSDNCDKLISGGNDRTIYVSTNSFSKTLLPLKTQLFNDSSKFEEKRTTNLTLDLSKTDQNVRVYQQPTLNTLNGLNCSDLQKKMLMNELKIKKPLSNYDFPELSSPMLFPKSNFDLLRSSNSLNQEEPYTGQRKSILKKNKKENSQRQSTIMKNVQINENLNSKHTFERYFFKEGRRIREGSYFDKLLGRDKSKSPKNTPPNEFVDFENDDKTYWVNVYKQI